MSDDTYRISAQSFRINTREEHEITYWTWELGVSREQLLAAVHQVGDTQEAVRQHLGK